jgi:hypothetical protein
LKFAELTEKEFLDKIEHLRDRNMWEKTSNGEWILLDWVGNHVWDKGVEDARLPIKEPWTNLKSPKFKSSRDYSLPDSDEELIFL